MKHYIITDEQIQRLVRYSKPGPYKSDYIKVLSELKKVAVPEGTTMLRAMGFNSEGKNMKVDIPLGLSEIK